MVNLVAWLINKFKNDRRTYLVTATIAATEMFLWVGLVKMIHHDPFDQPMPILPWISMWWIKAVGLIILFVGSVMFYTILSFKKSD